MLHPERTSVALIYYSSPDCVGQLGTDSCLLLVFVCVCVCVCVYRLPMGWTAEVSSSSPDTVKNFIFCKSSRPALGSTKPPIHWVPGALSPGVKRPGREADHRQLVPRSRKYGFIHSLPPYAFMAKCLIKHRAFTSYEKSNCGLLGSSGSKILNPPSTEAPLENLVVAQLVGKLLSVYGPEGSLRCSQDPATDPYPETLETRPDRYSLFL
jgi:hypothetical protein